jgi:hypothetical protein
MNDSDQDSFKFSSYYKRIDRIDKMKVAALYLRANLFDVAVSINDGYNLPILGDGGRK